MAVNLSPVGGVAAQFFDNAGNVLTGGKLYTYAAGTTTPQTTYTTSAGNVAWSNPIILDAAGRVSGSGEIWLNDGIQYKFILRDSNDVLIATYDNINGINSNFVNFTNEQEIQTATAGQTVFNLTTTTYSPGTNSLSVFVDGVNQYGPGAQYAYLETDADTVTFINGLHVGALVKFTTSQLNSSGAIDAAQVSYDPPFTNSVATNVEARLAQYVSVKDFGAVGDGVTNDRTAIQNAFSASNSVIFPEGTYYVGDYSTAEIIVDLSSLGEGVEIKTSGDVKLVCNTTASVMPIFFYLKSNSHFRCDPIRFEDLGYDPTITYKGARGFYLDCVDGGDWGDVIFEGVYCLSMVTPITISGNSNSRVRGVLIKQIYADNVYHGFLCQDNGDNVVINNLYTWQTIRSYYVYGVTGHKVNIYARNQRGTSGAVNIARQVSGRATQNLDISYCNRDTDRNFTHVLINHIDLLGGTISDIRLKLDIQNETGVTTNYAPLRFVNYTGSGGSETTAASPNIVRDIFVSGSCDTYATAIRSVASYGARNKLNFTYGNGLFLDATIFADFYTNRVSTPYTVTWGASGTAPVIGNGTLTGRVAVSEGIANCSITLTAGSTTTFGTGQWSFSLPYTTSQNAIGTVYMLDDGLKYYTGVCRALDAASSITCFYNDAASGVQSNIPFTWGSADTLILTITYPISEV
jgi:hypothetical protein